MPVNIYIVGAQCTGKTTLVKALQTHFGIKAPNPDLPQRPSIPSIITEVARTVLRQHNFQASDITSSPSRALEFQRLILKAQYDAERSTEAPWYICDRSGLDPIVYAERYVGANEAKEMTETETWLELRKRMSCSLIIVCEAGADWLIDDGVRLMPSDNADWMAFHVLFCQCLKDLGLEFTILPCSIRDIKDRVDFVVHLWEKERGD